MTGFLLYNIINIYVCNVVYINQYSYCYISNNPYIDKISIFDYYYFN